MSLDDWLGGTGKKKKQGKQTRKKGTTPEKPSKHGMELIEDGMDGLEDGVSDFETFEDFKEDGTGNEGREKGAGASESTDEGRVDEDGGERVSYISSLNLFNLKCTKCSFKRKVRIAGEPKPYHLLCKKCGSKMKVTRTTKKKR
ncbi:MAG: hypothetical protein ACTSUE_11205 [Promethearchaeota archaeon]